MRPSSNRRKPVPIICSQRAAATLCFEEVQKRINWEEKIHSFLRQAMIISLGLNDRSFEPG